jgi:23S rRNA pseudouridine2605 synthase
MATKKKKTESAKAAAKRAPKTKKSPAKAEKAIGTRAAAAPKKTLVKGAAEKKASQRAATTKKPVTRKTPAKTRKREVVPGETAGYRIGEPVVDPIGDVSSGEGRAYLGGVDAPEKVEAEAYREETRTEAADGTLESAPVERATQERAADAGAEQQEGEDTAQVQAPARLERLQKILSQAGIASRRRAEEMIVAGRVVVNGQVVTQLGSKADAARDHIRVDGKLIHGAERHRYFVLNKPHGFVTTVSDPEGRPTVMQFFANMHERLYPVGRLDYQSEGLLLMTNDGELANLLTKAGSGVEKTYLVKVAGQPTEEQLERLRRGVAIEKGSPGSFRTGPRVRGPEAGSERVRTAPAQIRQFREGENPWYEVVLTEGRNRELRKMFAAIGHFAEKIRRVGYGPLVLDVEPGKLRELRADEVNALRLTAEGKMKPRRVRADVMLPKEAGRAPGKHGERQARQWREKPAGKRFERARGGAPGRGGKPFRPREERGQKTEWKPREREFGGAREGGAERSGERPSFDKRQGRPFGVKPEFGGRRESGTVRSGGRPSFDKRRGKPFGARPAPGGRQEGKPFQREERAAFGERGDRPPRAILGFDKRRGERPGAKSEFGRRQGRPFGARPGFGGKPREQSAGRFENAPRKPYSAQGERPFFKQGEGTKKQFESERPPFKPRGERPPFERGVEGKRRFEGGSGKGFGTGAKPGAKPGGFGKFRGEGGRGKKFGGSRPGAAHGGWKRG